MKISDIRNIIKFALVCVVFLVLVKVFTQLYILNYHKNTHVSMKGKIVEIPGRYVINFDIKQNYYTGAAARDNVFFYGSRTKYADLTTLIDYFNEDNAIKLDCKGNWWEVVEPNYKRVLIYDDDTFLYIEGSDFQDLLDSYSKVFCIPN